jgi:hypothetical protein
VRLSFVTSTKLLGRMSSIVSSLTLQCGARRSQPSPARQSWIALASCILSFNEGARITAPPNKELKLTKPSQNGASQLNSVLGD